MDGHAVAGEPRGQHRHDPVGVRFQLAADDTIIGTAEQAASALQAWLDLLLTPGLENLMEQDMGSYGGNGAPLHDACGRLVQHACFSDPGTEPWPNAAHSPSIIDPLAEHVPPSSPRVFIDREIIYRYTNTLRY